MVVGGYGLNGPRSRGAGKGAGNGQSSFVLATVTATNPLQVQIDGSSTAISAMSLNGEFYLVGSRVLVTRVGNSAVVMGTTETPEYDSGWIYVGKLGGPSFNAGSAYGGSHQNPRFRRIGNLVFMEGLVATPPSSFGTIFTLPVGFRPSGNIIPMSIGNGQTEGHGIRINSTGTVVSGSGVSAWASISCVFPVDVEWHVIGQPGEPTFGSGWSNYGGGWEGARFVRIGNYVHLSGLVQRTSGSNTTIFNLPSGYQNTNGTTHSPCPCQSTMAGGDYGVNIGSAVKSRASGSNTGFVSLAGVRFFVGDNDDKWKWFSGGSEGWWLNGTNYGSGWPSMKVRRDGKIIFLEGLPNFSSNVGAKLPFGYGPGGQLIFPVVNSSNQRMDLLGPNQDANANENGLISCSSAGLAGLTHSWVVAEPYEPTPVYT